MKMNIKEIIESEARKRAEVWAINKKITTDRYPAVEEYLSDMKSFINIIASYDRDEFP